MILRIQIPDPLYEVYVAHAKGDEDQVPALMARHLETFRRVAPGAKVVVLSPGEIGRLEAMFQGFPINEGKDLLDRVQGMADVWIGGVQVKFTHRDLAGLKSYAEKNNISIQEAVQATVDRMKNHFISYLPEATAQAAMLKSEAAAPMQARRIPTPLDPPAPSPVKRLAAPPAPAPAVAEVAEVVEQPQEAPVDTVAKEYEEPLEGPHADDNEPLLHTPSAAQRLKADGPTPRSTPIPPRPHPGAGSLQEELSALGATEEGFGRLINPEPEGQQPQERDPNAKILPRPPRARVHERRRAVFATPAATGGEVRPAGWGSDRQ